MASVGDNIRYQMEQRNISISELQEKTNIPVTTLKNVLYNRSQKREYLIKICDALGISVEYIKALDSAETINLQIYKMACAYILDAYAHYKVKATKRDLQEYINSMYMFLNEEDPVAKDIASSYAKGMVNAGLNNLILRTNS